MTLNELREVLGELAEVFSETNETINGMFWTVYKGGKRLQFHGDVPENVAQQLVLYHNTPIEKRVLNKNKIHSFTNDEKAILRNLPKEYKWIARDRIPALCGYKEKPYKNGNWWVNNEHYLFLDGFEHLFQTVKWEDNEPCEFRKYL